MNAITCTSFTRPADVEQGTVIKETDTGLYKVRTATGWLGLINLTPTPDTEPLPDPAPVLSIYCAEDPCPKCGTHHTTTEWRQDRTEERRRIRESGAAFMGHPPAWWFDNFDIEHIKVICHHCGYFWRARTVDGWERS